jgi:hypothetical protein
VIEDRVEEALRNAYQKNAPPVDVEAAWRCFGAAHARKRKRFTMIRSLALGFGVCLVLAVLGVVTLEAVRALRAEREVLVLEMPSSPGGVSSSSGDYRVDVGSAHVIGFAAVWAKLASVGEFDSASATFDSLSLSFSSAGALRWIGIQGATGDGRRVAIAWDGTAGPEDQRVVVSESVQPVSANLPKQHGRIGATLAALDRVGVQTILELSGPVPPGGYYGVAPIQQSTGAGETTAPTIEPAAKAYLWERSKLVRLSSNGALRTYSEEYVYLGVYPMVPIPQDAGSDEDMEESFRMQEVTWFVIPSD